jgi:hypothetical protein
VRVGRAWERPRPVSPTPRLLRARCHSDARARPSGARESALPLGRSPVLGAPYKKSLSVEGIHASAIVGIALIPGGRGYWMT